MLESCRQNYLKRKQEKQEGGEVFRDTQDPHVALTNVKGDHDDIDKEEDTANLKVDGKTGIENITESVAVVDIF